MRLTFAYTPNVASMIPGSGPSGTAYRTVRALAGADSVNSTKSRSASSRTARRPEASEASVVKATSGPTMRAFVAPLSASYSTKSSLAPTPAVIFGSNATTVAGEGGGDAVAFKRLGASNRAAINRPAQGLGSAILKPAPL